MRPEEALVDRAQLLRLTGPEMTVLVGGLRVLGANAEKSKRRRLHSKPGTLTNDFFVNLLTWARSGIRPQTAPTKARPEDQCGQVTGTRADLVFGSHAQLRAFAESMRARTQRRSSRRILWRHGPR